MKDVVHEPSLGKSIGQFVSGSFTKLLLRQKSDQKFEIGELLVAGNNLDDYALYQINELMYGSQSPDTSLELIAGYQLEREKSDLTIYEPELRNYVLARARPLICVKKEKSSGKLDASLPKTLPSFLGHVYELTDTHLQFMAESEISNPITLGMVRSGSKILETEISLEALDVLTHHILIPATTGRGKSNLVKVILYNIMTNEDCAKLVFDPHNEYYESLRQHPESDSYLKFYTPRTHHKKIDLLFNVSLLRPNHIRSSIHLTEAQDQALRVYYNRDRDNNYENWIKNIFLESAPGVKDVTVDALRRKIGLLLNIEYEEDASGNVDKNSIRETGIYKFDGNQTILRDIETFLKNGKTVVIDSSLFSGSEEIFVATIIVEHLFREYRRLKFAGNLQANPVISIVLEEAPRVIGRKVLEVRDNIFGTIAREGRKFNMGLIAITQLPSIISREILANMNTKIILGNEMGPERKAIIESAAQDLSDDYQNIGSLDKGEAIITSNFTKFAVPIKISLFSDVVKKDRAERKTSSQKIKSKSPF